MKPEPKAERLLPGEDPPNLKSALDRIENLSMAAMSQDRYRRILELAKWAKAHLPGDWQPMASAPKDGTLVCLLVDSGDRGDDWTPTEDERIYATIGSNHFVHNDIDEWQFAGWCWSHDHFTEGKGKPILWCPYPDFTLQRKSFEAPTLPG